MRLDRAKCSFWVCKFFR